MLNLDTHVLLHAFEGSLKSSEERLLAAHEWSISAIVLWEVAKLVQLGRVELELDAPDVVRALARVHVWPITREVALASTRLNIRGDPADELIAATSLVHAVPLLTRDKMLLKSKRIPLAR